MDGETAVSNPSESDDREHSLDAAATSRRKVVMAYRMVQIAVVAGLVWKGSFFRIADQVDGEIPLADPFFPDWARSASVVRWAYLVAVLTTLVGALIANRWGRLRALAVAAAVASLSILCVHQATYNDATFTTSWWTQVWAFWFCTRMERDRPDRLLRRGAFAARAIGSMILIGGAVGKWTSEYWSGEVFYDIYFRERQYWTFNWVRGHFGPETLREIATWYSRGVVVTETVVGLGMWLLPPRAAATVGVVLFTSIALFSNHLLFSVMWCLIGLSAVGFLVPASPSSKP